MTSAVRVFTRGDTLCVASGATGAASGEVTAEPPPGMTFLDAVGEQLGLKLEPTKAPVQMLVIDHIERPSEN